MLGCLVYTLKVYMRKPLETERESSIVVGRLNISISFLECIMAIG